MLFDGRIINTLQAIRMTFGSDPRRRLRPEHASRQRHLEPYESQGMLDALVDVRFLERTADAPI